MGTQTSKITQQIVRHKVKYTQHLGESWQLAEDKFAGTVAAEPRSVILASNFQSVGHH